MMLKACQWKFLIHTILQSLSAKRTSWNEFSTAMASAVICLSKGQKFNFSNTPIPAAKPRILTITAAPAVSTRRRKGVVIRDPEEEFHSDTPAETPKRYHGMKKKPQTESEAHKNMIFYLKNTKEPNGQDAIWRNQKSVHGLALVKRWKLLTSCGVRVITLLTVQLFLLVERRYPLSRFTLEQLINVARLQVEEESEMSLELLRLTRQQLQEYQQG
nr:hypothetical protein [Tanacetum cinerariifolium]